MNPDELIDRLLNEDKKAHPPAVNQSVAPQERTTANSVTTNSEPALLPLRWAGRPENT